ncbi:hydrogen peroxide-dependent heme synthase [Aeromicrobium sp. 179-A 4D2 NHS]|uniref:hydrogen peroxide-dependent heme synthase n=1 Tax=Aeromicrobium sp. 179-A 4D2 NHS TaxID=3142375 RepID=UPI00399F12A1
MSSHEVDPEQINASIRYAMYSVFRIERPLAGADRAALAAEVESLFASFDDVVVRGTYDLSGMRAEADLMVWWHAPSADALQDAYNAFRRTELGSHLTPVWSNAGLHRPAEFNRSHVPNFMADDRTYRYVCVYPFVRSYEWYILPQDERSQMLREHGEAAHDYADVRANTIASFALGDYEWLLAFEADELHRIVDLMRELRATTARRHVREELPFYTGRLLSVAELTALWP